MKTFKGIFGPLKYLRVQIAVYFLLTSFLLMVILSSILYFSISAIMLKDALVTTSGSIEGTGHYIEVYVQKLKSIAQILSANGDTKDYLDSGDPLTRGRVMALIQDTLETDPFLVSVIIVGKDGQILSNEKDLDMTISGDMMKEPWYVKAISSDQMPVLTSIRQQQFSMDKENWVISLSQEITDYEGNNLGVLLVDIRYQVLEDYLKGLILGREGYAYIVNKNHEVVYHPDSQYFEDPSKRAALQKVTQMINGYEQSMNVLLHHYPIDHTDWILVGLCSLDNLASVRRQLIETLVFVSFILLLIVIGSGLMIAKRITWPIQELEKAMSSFELNFSRVDLKNQGCIEAERLTEQYNVMVERIQELMENIKKNEGYLRNYEIRALQSQINPHFLYNTLDTIVWMAEFKDHDKVIAITKSLAQFFRVSLSQGKEKIPLADEFDHVSQYLFIQKQRYESKLTYKIELDDKLKEIEVPKILLQPLVENAIYHGIRELDGVGIIRISARIHGDTVVLTVEDNGVGFDTEKIRMKHIKLGGIGIANVDQRVKLYYGDQYGVTVESQVGKGTLAQVKIPL
jgi:two-component system sensor histidine kinase YesM